MKRLTLMLMLVPLIATAGRKVGTGKSTYGGDLNPHTADLAISNPSGAAITFSTFYEARGAPLESAVFYRLHFLQALASPVEVTIDVPFEPVGPLADGGEPAFGLAFDEAGGVMNIAPFVPPCAAATVSSTCGAGSQCACAEAMVVNPSGGSSPLRFVLDSTQLPGAPATFSVGNEVILYFSDLSGKPAIDRPAAGFVSLKAGGQALTFAAGAAYTLDFNIPVPVLTAVTPPSRLRGLVGGLDLAGSGFIDGVQGRWDSAARVGHFFSATTEC